MHEDGLDYAKQAMLHGNIRSMYVLMMTAERAGTRLLGTFYRVGFYGAAFGDLDGRQFVYKEPDLTQLSEVTERLTRLWRRRLQAEVAVIKDSRAVDPGAPPDGPRLQVTHVRPAGAAEGGPARRTHFQRHEAQAGLDEGLLQFCHPRYRLSGTSSEEPHISGTNGSAPYISTQDEFVFETPFALGGGGDRGAARVTSDCHFRKTATEYDRKPGRKRLSCTAKVTIGYHPRRGQPHHDRAAVEAPDDTARGPAVLLRPRAPGGRGGGGGGPRVISDCHFAISLNRFIPGFLSYVFSRCFSKVTIGYYPRWTSARRRTPWSSGRNRWGVQGGSLGPPGPLLTHLHTVYMAYSERLPTRLNPLAERACFSRCAGVTFSV
jgi:hypothetical protein